jgi:hypothetical protein
MKKWVQQLKASDGQLSFGVVSSFNCMTVFKIKSVEVDELCYTHSSQAADTGIASLWSATSISSLLHCKKEHDINIKQNNGIRNYQFYCSLKQPTYTGLDLR